MDFNGKCALVTGAGSGIGRATALKFAHHGARVAALSRTKTEVDAVCEDIAAHGGDALPVYADVSDKADMQAAFDKISDAFGRLDICFANAGINGVWTPIEQMDPDDWDEVNAVNLRGTFLTVRHAIPLMRDNGGAIVITSSINGTRTFTSAGASAYAATKAGQLTFANMAALELAKYKIRVNTICPGQIDTAIAGNTRYEDTEKVAVPAHYPEGTIPLTGGKPGTSEDVAELVAFLASDNARHITGTPVWIDGAQSLLI